jgi:hypothetical protein
MELFDLPLYNIAGSFDLPLVNIAASFDLPLFNIAARFDTAIYVSLKILTNNQGFDLPLY